MGSDRLPFRVVRLPVQLRLGPLSTGSISRPREMIPHLMVPH